MPLKQQFSAKDAEILEEEVAYQGFFQIKKMKLRHQKFGGGLSREFERELFVRGPVAGVLPYDPVRDEVVLIEQFRHGVLEQDPPWLFEIVAGIIEEGESADELVKREAQEEAGLEIQKLIPLYRYWTSPGGTNEHMSLYCGIVDASCAGGIHGADHEDEDIKVSVVAADEAIEMINTGQINNATSIIALQWLALNKANLQST